MIGLDRGPIKDLLDPSAKVQRMVERYGHLPSPDEIRQLAPADPSAFDPRAQFRYRRNLEPPRTEEGFSAIEVVPFTRRPPAGHEAKAVFLDYAGVLCDQDHGLLPGRADLLRRYHADGWLLLAMSWRPDARADAVAKDNVRVAGQLGLDIDAAYCPHPAGPPICWCRKPLPGLAVAFVAKYRLDPTRCILVGRSAADRTLAERMGFRHVESERFFADDAPV